MFHSVLQRLIESWDHSTRTLWPLRQSPLVALSRRELSFPPFPVFNLLQSLDIWNSFYHTTILGISFLSTGVNFKSLLQQSLCLGVRRSCKYWFFDNMLLFCCSCFDGYGSQDFCCWHELLSGCRGALVFKFGAVRCDGDKVLRIWA